MTEPKATHKQITDFYTRAATATTATAIIDAATDATDGHAELLADCMFALAENRRLDKADIEKELSDYRQFTDEARAKAKVEKEKATRKQKSDSIKALLDTYNTAIDTDNKSAAGDTVKDIERIVAELGNTDTDNVEERRATWEKDADEWKHDTGKEFTPELFGKLAFPNGSVSYIGARTGRGKTTAMVNLAREAIKEDRKTLFISLEESNRQILRRFALCLAYTMADENERKELLSVSNPFNPERNNGPSSAYNALRRGRDLYDGPGVKAFTALISKAIEQLQEVEKKGLLAVYDMRGKNLHSIMRLVRDAGKDATVLLDYIQKIPAGGAIHGGNPDLIRIAEGSEALINAAKTGQCAVIAGAQLNRASQEKGQTKIKDDTFADADFRGCGDIEQDAHNAIGIGRIADKTQTFYGIIKTREDQLTDTTTNLDFIGGYSFMANTEALTSGKKKADSNPKQDNSETNGKMKTPASKKIVFQGSSL
jgi:hypothetical protein